jgi:hypothetical protein
MARRNRPVSRSAVTHNPRSVSIATGIGSSAIVTGLTQQCLARDGGTLGQRHPTANVRDPPPGAPIVLKQPQLLTKQLGDTCARGKIHCSFVTVTELVEVSSAAHPCLIGDDHHVLGIGLAVTAVCAGGVLHSTSGM